MSPRLAARRNLPGSRRPAPGRGDVAPLLRRWLATFQVPEADRMEINDLARATLIVGRARGSFLPGRTSTFAELMG
jgi:hypothetical protein